MNLISLFIIDTVSILILAMISIGFILYRNNKNIEKLSKTNEKTLKLRFGRVFTYAGNILLFFSMFIHSVIYIVINLIEGDKPGLSFSNGFVGVFGVVVSIILLTLLFYTSVPNMVLFIQFLKCELNRIIIINELDKIIKIYYIDRKTIVRNDNVQLVAYHEKLKIARGDQALDYIKIYCHDNSQLVVTNLLTRLNIIEFIYKGVNREHKRNIFNKITSD